MTPDQLFQVANTIVLPAWLLLILAPTWKWTGRIVVGIVVTILSVLYVIMLAEGIESLDFSSFGSLEGVMQLFTEPSAVAMGWIHYLAFDLMVGWFIVNDAHKHGINRYLTIPCLLLSFMLGPTGLLLYLLLRLMLRKQYFSDQVEKN
ncbi:MAG: DUF4281 domain-containing protein [Saprospiraceae bacterium]|nr:DUF4281 domain-containing protein [Saprospiraceae bacterium]